MSFKIFTDTQKLDAIHRLIVGSPNGEQKDILKVLARDIQARAPFARDAAILLLERRLQSLIKSRTALGYHEGSLRECALEFMNKWPVIRDALIDRNIKTSPPEPSRNEQ